jgi:hypothetical protein
VYSDDAPPSGIAIITNHVGDAFTRAQSDDKPEIFLEFTDARLFFRTRAKVSRSGRIDVSFHMDYASSDTRLPKVRA